MKQASNTKNSGKGIFEIAASFQPNFNPTFEVEPVGSGESLKVKLLNTVGYVAADVLYSNIYLRDANGAETKANLDKNTFTTTATTINTSLLNPSTEWNGRATIVKIIAGEEIERNVELCIKNPLLAAKVTFGAQYKLEIVPNPIVLPIQGGTKKVKCYGNVAFNFTLPSWLKAEQSANKILFKAESNTSGIARTATVTVQNSVGLPSTTINFQQA